MNTIECISTRRSHRRFLPEALPRELLEQIVEAGRCAPSGGNSQTCHFIVITDPTVLDRLAELVQLAFAPMEVTEGMYRSLAHSITASKRGDYVFHYHAPALIIVANRQGYGNAMADSACALQNMMLAANELELGSCWINQLHWLDGYSGVTGRHPALDECLHGLGLGADETICGALSVGYVEKVNREPMQHRTAVTWVE